MKRTKIATISIFCMCLIINANAQKPVTIRVDPANASGESSSHIFDQIDFIPLESTKRSLFGQIDKLLVTKDYFIILDNTSTFSIFIFNRDGSFHAKISNQNSAILPYFSYEKEKNRLLIFFLNQSAIPPQVMASAMNNPLEVLKLYSKYAFARYFDMNGRLLNEKASSTAIADNFETARLSPYITATSFFLADKRLPDSTGYQLSIMKNGRSYKSWFPYNTNKDMARCGRAAGGGGFSQADNDSSFYFTRPLDYVIYKVTGDSVQPLYQFIFPLKNTIPETYFTDTFNTEKDREAYFLKNPDLIKIISDVYAFNKTILFKVSSVRDVFIYGLRSGNLFSLNRLAPDIATSWLPLFGDRYNIKQIEAKEKEYVYISLSSYEMFKAKEIAGDKHLSYPKVLDAYFKSQTRKSNPVIIQLKPKGDL